VRAARDEVAEVREEREWPLARTEWAALYLGGGGEPGGAPAAHARAGRRPLALTPEPPSAAGQISFETRSHAAAFTWRFPDDTALSGPMAARLWVEIAG
jgi:hypothetical protein